MLDDKVRAELDQSRAVVTELLPPLWKGMFDALIEEGFDHKEAMDILDSYIFATNSTS